MKKQVLSIGVLLFAMVVNSFGADIQTYRNDELGFEISYFSNWKKEKSLNNAPFFINRNSTTEIGTISVDVRNFKGNRDEFMGKVRLSPNMITEGIKKRFPDASLGEHSETYLGGFPAYFITTYYTLKNLNVEIPLVTLQIVCIKGKFIYLVMFESTVAASEKIFDEFQAILSTFNFR